MSQPRKINRALFSLSDKAGAAELAQALSRYDVEIISTGGTAKFLRESGLSVTEVSEVTGFPEMMDGRVKTLHPKIHGALLALRDNPEHVASMQANAIAPIDLIVVNLYPFENTVAKENVDINEAVENIDIGGPAMIRSAAKNWRDVCVIIDPRFYSDIIKELSKNNGELSIETRQRHAALAFARTADYDRVIATYLTAKLPNDADLLASYTTAAPAPTKRAERAETGSLGVFETDGKAADNLNIALAKIADLRYGENPHQRAALYRTEPISGLAAARQLHGKEMSFNNYVDADAAWNLVADFDQLAVAIIKHTNPSGVGLGSTNAEAYRRALSTDPISAFGGIVAFNRAVDADGARAVNEIFTEVIVAPDFDFEALEVLRAKKNLRVLCVSAAPHSGRQAGSLSEYKQISGGFLVQDRDSYNVGESDLKIVTSRAPSHAETRAMLLAWKVCKHVKSNAIVLANDTQTIGVGSGQMNRVDSVRIAAIRAERFKLPVKASALASDAFFPFRDNVDEAAKMGVTAIIQPGGSVKDAESVAAADEHGITMAFTGYRHFKH